MEVLWVVLGIVVVLAIAGVVSYNRFVSQKNLIKDAWANIDTELRRRYDLIPNIVETVKGYATHEREVFENVTRARANATGATGSPAAQAAAEGPLVAALRQLFAVVENYPDLKANQNFLALQAELTNTEDRLQTARRFYNANVRDYNQRVQSVPSNVIANLFNFEEEEFFEVEEALRGDEGVPRVSFEAGAPGVSFGTPSEPSTAPPATPPAGMPPPAEPSSAAPPERPDEPAGLTRSADRGDRLGPGVRSGLGAAQAGPADAAAEHEPDDRPGHRHAAEDRDRDRGADLIGDHGGDQRGHRERQRDQHVVEAEDPAADVIGDQHLEPVRREHPLRPAAEVRDADHHGGDRERGGLSHRHVPEPEHGERQSDRGEEPTVPGSGDAVPEERADQRADATRGHQDAEADVARVEHIE